jgi:pimeloyl-ACP methyl ester carboxylesterase
MVARRKFWWPVLFFLFIATSGGALFYARPTWVLDRVMSTRLRLAGVETHEVMIGGNRIHYYVRGPEDGPAIVMVHGLGGRSEDWLSLTPYLVKAGYRVYTPDLLGFGQSEEPRDATYSIADQSELVVHFMDAMHIDQADLAGWSMGGWIAQKVAVDYPERVRRLILMDSAGLHISPNYETRLFTPTNRTELNQLNALLTPNAKPVPGFVAKDILKVSADYAWVVKRALASMYTAEDVTDDDLPSLRMPVLILWGAQDRITPLSEGQAIHALIPQSLLVVASGCGHLAPQECANQFGPEMTRFLRGRFPSMSRVAISGE